MPLMVELVMDTQIIKERSEKSDKRSHTGNSWNQSDIDEAYAKYYCGMPDDSDTSWDRPSAAPSVAPVTGR